MQHGLAVVGRSVSLPPLGLLTVAACLPEELDLRLVDLNAEELHDFDLLSSEVVLVGGMLVQAASMREVIERCRRLGRRVVVGGPAATSSPELFDAATAVFQGEVEGREAELLDLVHGRRSGLVRPGPYPNLSRTKTPRYDLLDRTRYGSMSLQYSRGCPYHCEFCDVVELFGRVPRVKPAARVLAELDALQATGYSGSVFFVDDNFIGNRRAVRELIPELIRWQERNRRPFDFYTEASVNLASDPELLDGMVEAGFSAVFLGIETPSAGSLTRAGKAQNLRLDLRAAVDTLTRAGLEVMGGFIVGMDGEAEGELDAHRSFLRDAPIPMAMAGLLTALPGTQLAKRLTKEGRLRSNSSGDQFGRPNFEPERDELDLLEGYAALLSELYAAPAYYARLRAYLRLAAPPRHPQWPSARDLHDLVCGIAYFARSPRGRHFYPLFVETLFRRPAQLKWVVVKAILGEHLLRYTAEEVLPRLQVAMDEAPPRASAGRTSCRIAVNETCARH
ncbi:MAG: B12-binding domain-containing radical SAM protein [Polyangiales bacterium]